MPSNASRLKALVQTNDLDGLRKRIAQKQALFKHQDTQENRLLHWACGPEVSLDMLRLVMTAAGRALPQELQRFNAAGSTPLGMAAAAGRLDLVDELLAHGAQVQAQRADEILPPRGSLEPRMIRVPSGTTALHEASTPEVAQRLVGAGAVLEAPDQMGFTPFLSAVQARRLDVLDALLALGANPHAAVVNLPSRATMMGATALHLAMVCPDNGVIVQRLLDVGVSPYVRLPNGATPAERARQRFTGTSPGPGNDLMSNLAVLERWELLQDNLDNGDFLAVPSTGRPRL